MKKLLCVGTVVILLAGCQKKEKGISSSITFNLDKFEQNIKDTYGAQTVGFSYAIAVGETIKRYGAMGNARLTVDGLETYTSETRQEIFSVNKFFTAMAVLKALQLKGKTPDELITPYLPASWTIHNDYKTLTFRQLLAHQSGFPMENRTYDSLKFMMTLKQGSTARSYNNANFALCRILLPYIVKGKAFFQNINQDETLDKTTAGIFLEQMRELVLKPAGLTYWNKVDFKDWNHQGLASYPYTRYYNKSDAKVPSDENSDDLIIAAGSRGLTLSAYEVVQVMIAFEQQKIVSANLVTMMKNEGCGFDGVGGWPGVNGKYFWKNGGGSNGRGAGGESIIMIFPINNVMVNINCNSNRKPDDSFVSDPSNIAKAYDNAW